jgi:hypothetical protein
MKAMAARLPLSHTSSECALPVKKSIIKSLISNGIQFKLLEDQCQALLSALNLSGDLLEALLLELLLKSLESLLYVN